MIRADGGAHQADPPDRAVGAERGIGL